ncbi:hypothetical protein PTSG_10360 [Salpingoeca rosetta]|uniref:ADP-ribosylation/Crystallin J1 n=1 Tax=Salpingoeca rosetta (strain ATCC 50818 / BSB-021) TaxID=946362 RepID=F2UR31_SALR5|nr:uncharacterized protein PTSG_10360 [Salpingoeca rosetta]EGD80086.1 hypothetical protein PTSG_10360 [Salpingoeca rosetta]|eukprot:XP_004988411.1 hypothetical protein PTSG_10360 [Salpingoeca rosetta]
MSARRACVVGGLLSDAATTPLHWVYDVAKLSTFLKENGIVDEPEFCSKPQCPFYEAKVGDLSPYGGEYVAMLNGLAKTDAANKGTLDPKAVEKEMCEFFASWKGYKNHVTKTLEANAAKGATYPDTADKDDNQANGMAKAPLIAAAFGKADDFVATAKAAVALMQSRPSAVQYGLAAAIITKNVLDGATVGDAIKAAESSDSLDATTKADITDVLANKDGDIAALSKKWGISCSYPGAFKLSLLVILQSSSFKEAVRTNIKLGGDNCSRAAFIGGVFAAASPDQVPEEEWFSRTADAAAFRATINTLFPAAE